MTSTFQGITVIIQGMAITTQGMAMMTQGMTIHPTGNSMLEIRDLVKVYPGPVAALQGVSIDVSKGMFGLLGPNGAGKTTLMRIVAGLLEPTSGNVLFNGEDIVDDPRLIRKTAGLPSPGLRLLSPPERRGDASFPPGPQGGPGSPGGEAPRGRAA